MKLAYVAAAAATVLALAIPAAASAAKLSGDWTADLGYSLTDVSSGPQLGAVTARVTFRSNMFVGFEGEASTGTHQDLVGTTNYNLSDQFGGYLTGTFPVSKQFEIFARAGYSKAQVKTLPRSNGDAQSYNYGAGVNWFLADDKLGFRADYTHADYLSSAATANIYSVSVIRKF